MSSIDSLDLESLDSFHTDTYVSTVNLVHSLYKVSLEIGVFHSFTFTIVICRTHVKKSKTMIESMGIGFGKRRFYMAIPSTIYSGKSLIRIISSIIGVIRVIQVHIKSSSKMKHHLNTRHPPPRPQKNTAVTTTSQTKIWNKLSVHTLNSTVSIIHSPSTHTCLDQRD